MVEVGIRLPVPSPNLVQVWRTPVNSKILLTGSLGMDPLIVEEKHNYPRFKILVEGHKTDEDIEIELKEEVCELEKILDEKFRTLEEEDDARCYHLTRRSIERGENYFPPHQQVKIQLL